MRFKRMWTAPARRYCAPLILWLIFGVLLAVSGCSGPGADGAVTDAGNTHSLEQNVFPSPPGSAVAATLVRVVDGDTIWVRLGDGREEKVRYIGLDAPEVAHPDSPAERLGEEASRRNEQLLRAGPLRLELDVEERDRFGRLLAYVWAGDVFVNGRLALEGYVRVHAYEPNVKYQEILETAEREARGEGAGLWGVDATAGSR